MVTVALSKRLWSGISQASCGVLPVLPCGKWGTVARPEGHCREAVVTHHPFWLLFSRRRGNSLWVNLPAGRGEWTTTIRHWLSKAEQGVEAMKPALHTFSVCLRAQKSCSMWCMIIYVYKLYVIRPLARLFPTPTWQLSPLAQGMGVQSWRELQETSAGLILLFRGAFQP